VDDRNVLAADQVAVELHYVGGNRMLSLVEQGAVIGGLTRQLASNVTGVTATSAIPGAAGARDDIWINVPDKKAWIHTGSEWLAWPEPDPPASSGGLVGEIKMWPSTTVPPGHLLCDGQTFDPTVYPQLYAVLGRTTLPDLRGQFLRGWGAPAGPSFGQPILTKMPGSTARPTNEFIGVTDSHGEHKHSVWTVFTPWDNSHAKGTYPAGKGTSSDGAYSPADATASGQGIHSHTLRINSGGDAETRPENTLVAFIIKALP